MVLPDFVPQFSIGSAWTEVFAHIRPSRVPISFQRERCRCHLPFRRSNPGVVLQPCIPDARTPRQIASSISYAFLRLQASKPAHLPCSSRSCCTPYKIATSHFAETTAASFSCAQCWLEISQHGTPVSWQASLQTDLIHGRDGRIGRINYPLKSSILID